MCGKAMSRLATPWILVRSEANTQNERPRNGEGRRFHVALILAATLAALLLVTDSTFAQTLLINTGIRSQQQSTPTSTRAASSGPMINFDIVGIKLGMPAKDAMVALKADNPRLALTPASFKYEGFANPLIPVVDGSDVAPTANAAVRQASETVQILFTTPPGPEVVWAMGRRYSFPTAERPSMQAILEALRKKYGPETVPPGPPNTSQSLVWIYDPQGRAAGSRGPQLNTICASTLLTYTGDAAMAINADIHAPRAWPPECTSIIVIKADVLGAQIAPNQFAASSMEVHMYDGGRYRAALEATRGVILNAVRAREQKQADEVNKRSAPKL